MLADRLSQINETLPSNVHLLAVSKGHPASSIRALVQLGQRDFGESRLQEALPKLKALSEFEMLRWHFVGRLQSNKVRGVVQSFQVIHSVDSVGLAERISRIAGEENCCPKVMLQVKFREDPTKTGFLPKEVRDGWPYISKLPNLLIIGLMTMPPKRLGLEERRALFKDCREFADQLGLQDCSMGMSDDWKEAVESGATWLRLGSKLFGMRPNHDNLCRDITKS